MTSSEFIAWAEKQDSSGVKDAMGGPWTSWLIAVKDTDGKCARDKFGHQVFQTQAEYKRISAVVQIPIAPKPARQQLELFAA